MSPDPAPQELPDCPVCGGRLAEVSERLRQRVVECVDCGTNLSIPGSAWDVTKMKRLGIWNPKKAADDPEG